MFFGGKALNKLLFLPGSKFLSKLRRGRLDSWFSIFFFFFSNKTLPFNWNLTLKIIYFFNNKYFQKYFDTNYQYYSEKAMAPHSSTLAWRVPWTEEPGGLQSMGSLGVGHDWATSLSLITFMHWRRKWQPTPGFLPGESQGRGSLVAAVYGVTQSRTRLKWLSIA